VTGVADRRLRVARPLGRVDLEAAERAARALLEAAGAGVVVDAEDLCMTVGGVKAPGVRTVTSALRGQVRDDPRTRAEFLALATTMRG
jgi:GTP cyclohydrolase I